MPDVTRSDSQRSDASLRPRVSFNRDVHVKRIVPNEASRAAGALSGDGAGHLLPSPVRKARLPKSKQQLAEEAAKVLHEVDKLDCVSSQDRGVTPEKFYTLPARRKHKINTDSPQSSIERKTRRRKSEELGVTTESPPKKPPRTFAHYPKAEKPQRASIFNIFKKSNDRPKKSNLKRSVSDATNLKSKAFGPITNNDKPFRKRSGSDSEENAKNLKNNKKQLSPIIEVAQRDDYFSKSNKENINSGEGKENVEHSKDKAKKKKEKKGESVTEQLKEYIDEVDTALFNETGIRVDRSKVEKKIPEIVIIDVDKAEKISSKKDSSKGGAIAKRIKFLANKKDKPKKSKTKSKAKEKTSTNAKQKGVLKTNDTNKDSKDQVKVELIKIPETQSPAPKIKEVIDSLESNRAGSDSPKMIHSSQKPADKLPLTRGLTVDSMVKRLNSDKSSPPPPKTSIMVTPNVTVQHNNNQPFSYTRGHSPERNFRSPDGSNPGSPIIYAHVVCDKGGINNSGPTKQTVHTAYTNGRKHLPHSDSDEGLGNEEHSSFSRNKYENEKTVTHFGDERYRNERNGFNSSVRLNDDPLDEEYPITPKFRNVGYFSNGYTKTEHSIFIDSSSRGRGDGMDAKRRESLTEPHENGFVSPKYRTDLSARRDLLESRINRRMGEKMFRQSPPSNVNSKYVSEKTSKYYRHGSASPTGFTETYLAESKTDRNGERYTTESRTKKSFGENDNNNRYVSEYRHNNYDNEPKSFDSQISDYRSSPENIARRVDASHEYKYTHSKKYMSRDEKQKLLKDREHYKSNPEIIQRNYDNSYKYDDCDQETYHDSLRREKHETRTTNGSKYHNERYYDQNDPERKDKLGDSGIENDFKRDSGDSRTPRSSTQRREYCNESEDEGFASSLLIASERQHTEENINQRKIRRDYDSDRGYREERDRERENPFRNIEHMDYKMSRDYKSKDLRQEYAPRERSIDDGSHYDPRIDKDFEADRSTLKKKVDKKPPKPEKKSGLEKVKQLFSRDSSKKKKEKERVMVPEENLRARYTEYKGSRENLGPKAIRKNVSEVKSSYEYSNRRRLSTPSPSPTREVQRNGKPEATHGSWFKSLDRLSRKKSKKDEKDGTSEEEVPPKPTPAKNLRFFGDTDIESNDSLRHKPSIKTRPSLTNASSNYHERTRSQSTRDLHNISEERQSPEFITPVKSSNHKSLLNISESERETKGSRLSLKPPMSPNHRANRDVSRGRDDRGRRRRNEVSSVESSTEGDSSQQSQRSVVYLHAATVGDIPGPGHLRNGRRAASREELTSNSSSNIRPQTKTLSRSFSVLAPWRPRHPRESYDIDYTQYPKQTKNGKYEQKVTKNGNTRKDNSSTLKKKANETKKSNQNITTLTRKSRSKENLSSQNLRKSKEDVTKGSSSTLYKKKERQPKETSRYNRDREEKRISSKSMSVESLGNGRDRRGREESRDISRSVSMPRDPEKSAGWFKMNKKSKKSLSTQRL